MKYHIKVNKEAANNIKTKNFLDITCLARCFHADFTEC